MSLLIKNTIPIGFQDQKNATDIFIEDGIIKEIGLISRSGVPTLEGNNLMISPGWLDLRVMTNDPGYDHREDLFSISHAAAKGGFTHIMALPNTLPIIQGKESANYLIQFDIESPVKIVPMPAATKDLKGRDMNDLLDLSQLGLSVFGDGNVSIHRTDTMILLLQYLKQFEGILFQFPHDHSFKDYGLIHEGSASALTGMKGVPSISEYLIVQRDIELLRVYGGRLHFSCITTKESVKAIREAKKEGLAVSCDTAAHYLAFCDSDLQNFDTNLKVFPPFRTVQDIEALNEGLTDGTIDIIVSDHQGVDYESKNLEFDLADFGISSIETTFSTLNTFSNLDPNSLVQKLSINPRKLLGFPIPTLSVGSKCDFTLFNCHEEYLFSHTYLRSKSKNSPFDGRLLKGKVLATCLGDKIFQA